MLWSLIAYARGAGIDAKELESYSPHLNFLRVVDNKTGYRTKQMLVAPIIDPQGNELVGVIQIINNKAGVPFGRMASAVSALAAACGRALLDLHSAEWVDDERYVVADGARRFRDGLPHATTMRTAIR